MRRIDPDANTVTVDQLKGRILGGVDSATVCADGDIEKAERLLGVLRQYPITRRRICLISPPQLNPEAAMRHIVESRRYMAYPPHGLLVLSAAVGNLMPGWTVEIVDLNLEVLRRTGLGLEHDRQTLLDLIDQDCDVYGVTMMFESSEAESVGIMRYLKERGKFVVAGGVQSAVDFKELLGRGYSDIVIKGEGDAQFCRLLHMWERVHDERFESDAPYPEIHNLSFFDQGEVVSFNEAFEDLVFPDIREECCRIDLDEYNKYGSMNIWCRIAAKGRKCASLITNRGCRGNCVFCQVTKAMGHGVRSRSINDVLDEIQFLYHEHGVRHIEIMDDDFLGNHDRTLELLHRWAELGIDLTFSTAGGVLAISIDEEVARAMDEAGCVMTGFGIETGNEKRLKSLRKPATLERVRQACEIFKANHRHIWLQANFILGFPNETFGEILDTFNYARDLAIDYCQPAILTPIRGTSIYEEYVSLRDERVIESFGKEKIAMHTPGRGLVSKGLTFDDVYEEVYDFRTFTPESVLTPIQVQQFLIYFNVFINLIGSVNLKPGGMPEKIRSFTDDVLNAYPMDAVGWGVNAKASELLGDGERYEYSVRNYRRAVGESRFWTEFFKIYNVPELLGIDL